MGNNSQRKILYAIICITALIGISYLTRDYWYPTMISHCRACGLKYFPEYSPTPSPNVTFIPHQHPPPPYTETVPPTEIPSLNPN
ncbi:hypothetical protein A3K80_07555 [Candidatus Bathyarchaeota archaeon RBG_13_38_9]|nr:MAG: hypothetical protein A3K80_07555 [Candidatus Bathyarchaeota archaeon RBG_13_38_9]